MLLLLFWCSVHGHRKDSLEHHLLQPGCIHQNFAKLYNDRTDLIINIILTALGKDICLLASACLAKDSSAYNCIERQWKQYQFTDEVTFLSHRRHSSAKFFWLQTSSLIYTSHHQFINFYDQNFSFLICNKLSSTRLQASTSVTVTT